MVAERKLSQRRIRILRVITRLNIGGPALHVSLLSQRLDPARFETLLVAGHEDAGEGSMVDLGRVDPRLRVIRVPTLGRAVSPLDDARSVMSLIGIARRYRPDIVHTHLAKAGFAGRIAGRLVGARAVVHTYHGSVFRGYFGRGESMLYLAIERALGRFATDRVVAITPRQRVELIELGVAPADRIVMIPLGLDLAPFLVPVDRAEARRALGIPDDGPLVGTVARLVPIKDLGTFLRGFALVHERMPSARAVIVGDGEERAALEALARDLGIMHRVHFAGWRADVRAVYAALDLVGLTSLNEGSPVSLIEAMAAGRAVVATAVGGVPDVVRDGETGSLVPSQDPAAFATAMGVLLMDDARRAAWAAAGRAAVYPRFDVSRLVADVERLYLGLLAQSPIS